MPADDDYFILWQNDNTIVVGKHQNTIEEINKEFVEKNKINVVRRITGGGAVYHDLGNINYSIITSAGGEELDFRLLTKPIIEALSKIGISAEFNSRNDITIDGKKFSGNAQFISNGRLLHHGTILFNSDLGKIQEALNVRELKIESKGIKSVKSRVTNIKPYMEDESIDTIKFKEILTELIFENNKPEIYELNDVRQSEVLELMSKKYETWEWNYGQSPEYDIEKEKKFDFALVSLKLKVTDGKIMSLKIYGDFFGNFEIAELENALTGVLIKKEDIEKAISKINIKKYINGMENKDFLNLVLG